MLDRVARHAESGTTARRGFALGRRSAWLWGRLADFERKDIFERDPNDLIAEMPAWMRDGARERVAKLCQWLRRIGEADV